MDLPPELLQQILTSYSTLPDQLECYHVSKAFNLCIRQLWRNLQQLDASLHHLKADNSPSVLSQLPRILQVAASSLRSLSFSGQAILLTDNLLQKIMKYFRRQNQASLELHLQHCTKLSLSGIETSFQGIPIHYLDLSSCNLALSSHFLHSPWSFNKELVHFRLDWCQNFPQALSLQCPNLRHLSVRGVGQIPNEAIPLLFVKAKHLETIDLAYCGVSDNLLHVICVLLRHLRQVTLAQSHENTWLNGTWTMTYLKELRQQYPHINFRLV